MNDLESLLNEHDEGCIGPSLQGTCDCMEKRAIARIEELELENEKLREIEIIQEGSHIRVTIGGSDALPFTIHKSTGDLSIYPNETTAAEDRPPGTVLT